MDLDNENDIETGQAEAELTDDPLQFFEAPGDPKLETSAAVSFTASPTAAPDLKPATAEALASDEDAEFTEYREFLREHVPHWTREPDSIDWCDQENPTKSIDEDTQRKIKHGDNFIEELKARYDGPTFK